MNSQQQQPPSHNLDNTTAVDNNNNLNNHNILNTSNDKRDSAYWSIGSTGDASKHTSVESARMSLPTSSPSDLTTAYHPQYRTPPNISYVPDRRNTPPPPIHTLNRPLVSPSTNNGMSVASLVSPSTTSAANMDERMLGMLNRGQSDVSARSSYVSIDSRRDSIDSRSINNAINDMKLNPVSAPYPNSLPSTTSIQATLQNQRDPRNGPERLSASRFPSGQNSMNFDKRPGPRTAPAITGVTPSQYAHTATPIAGQAWAGPFDGPDDHIKNAPSITGSSRYNSYLDSRRGSVAESFASTASQMTTESSLPHGQRRLNDMYYPGSGHSPAEITTHHHQLKNKQLGDIRDEEAGSPGIGAQPYSRTPELRVSHKLAERKRRDEMKTLYDTLRDLQPQERGAKASKWEILSRAIAEHKAQAITINGLQQTNQQLNFELQASNRENAQLREELAKLRAYQSTNMQQSNPAQHGQTTSNMTSSSNYSYSDYGRGQANRTDLPLPRLLEPTPGNPDSMSGVQYHTSSLSSAPTQTSYRHDGSYPPRM